MGNVNGSNTLSAVEEDGAENSSREAMAASDGTHVAMGHSPPHSPRATQSPLMFAPQVPVLPLQRPDEIHIPNPSWMQPSVYEGPCNEQQQGIPTMITWCHGGKEIAVEGSWDNWKTRICLQRSGKDFTIMKVLPSGVYEFRFIVDGQWMHAPELPSARDDAGNTYNILDLQDYVPEDIESISGFEPPQSPESSYDDNPLLGAEDYSKEPPVVPPHLQMTLLNLSSTSTDIPSQLPRPQHVILNHIFMQKGRSGPSIVALGSTHRFLAKYVTVVLYKSMQR
ncbi:PREDICTED: SNF1-related protein kinase regulatory subunit beta-2-like [Tarenaya hassleriana]|uniref:SNF1-related protein kinase regulatory subunit beta-2-like n=1 Tax=Tarenaya hassleriana TaxID=28532 RepID=UPI00053C482D|nr:PREDICTED: SNF1-related protein kinase regulatory subunit beta-2-like [Tarenaya hassleriana]